MRVAALIHFSVPKKNAGSEVMVHRMLAELVAHGHEVRAFVTENPDPVYDSVSVVDGVEVQELPVTSVPQDVVRWRPDVVVTHHHMSHRVPALARMMGVPWVLIVHNDHRVHMNLVDTGAPALTVLNTRWILRKHEMHFRHRRALVVHPPVDADRHRTSPGDCVTLVNGLEEKGASTFYALAERMPDTRFLLVEGAYGKQVVRDLTNVVHQPHTSDMRGDVWSRTRVLLMPSAYESYGLVGVEALCSGIPVVAHPTTGLVESLSFAGIFADRDDVDAWEHLVSRLLGDELVYERASELARDRAGELDPMRELSEWVRAVESLRRAPN